MLNEIGPRLVNQVSDFEINLHYKQDKNIDAELFSRVPQDIQEHCSARSGQKIDQVIWNNAKVHENSEVCLCLVKEAISLIQEGQ